MLNPVAPPRARRSKAAFIESLPANPAAASPEDVDALSGALEKQLAKSKAKIIAAMPANPAAAAPGNDAAEAKALERQMGGGRVGPEPFDAARAAAQAAEARKWIAAFRAKLAAR